MIDAVCAVRAFLLDVILDLSFDDADTIASSALMRDSRN